MKKVIIVIVSIIAWILAALLLVWWFISYRANSFSKSYTKSRISQEQPSWLYTFEWTLTSNKYVAYQLKLVDDSSVSLSLSEHDYDWIKYVAQFSSYINLNLKFENWKLIDWNAVEEDTNKNLWKLEDVDILSIVDRSRVEYVSKNNFGEEVFFSMFEKYLFNDTEKTVGVECINDDFWNITKSKSKLKTSEIMELDCDYIILK